jgi:hypothetical protein
MRSLRRCLTIAVIFVLAMLALPAGRPTCHWVTRRARRSRPSAHTVVRTTILRPRDTIEMALERGGVSRRDAREISAALRRKVNLRRLAPGEQIAIKRGRTAICWRSCTSDRRSSVTNCDRSRRPGGATARTARRH